jgi:SAM-dependent methyltransferase
MRRFCRLPPEQVRLPAGRPRPPRFDRRVNTLFSVEAYLDERILRWADALGMAEWRQAVWRKVWEWGSGLYALDRLGVLARDKVALAVAAGHENIIYYLTQRLQKVYASDIYGEGSFAAEGTASTDVLANFAAYSPFKDWDASRVEVLKLDARNLSRFADASVDIVFSFSSIEHFPVWGNGSANPHTGAAQAMAEQARVLKPGGVCIAATEVILNGREECEWPDFFTPEELVQFVVNPATAGGLELIEDIDWSISKLTLDATLNIGDPDCVFFYPHATLRDTQKKCVFSSVVLVFQKAP